MNMEINKQLNEAMQLAMRLKRKFNEFTLSEEHAKVINFDIEEIDTLDDKIVQVINSLGYFIGRSLANDAINKANEV
jgi:uncharacterized protein YqeY